jgi:DNA-directed RNA polymerase subunit beta'
MIFADVDEVHVPTRTGRWICTHGRVRIRYDVDDDDPMVKQLPLRRRHHRRAGHPVQHSAGGLPFGLIDRELSKKAISQLINACYRRLGLKDTVVFADQLMYHRLPFLHALPGCRSAPTTW